MLTNPLIKILNKLIIIASIVALLLLESCSPTYFNTKIRYAYVDSKKISNAKVTRLDMSGQHLAELPSDLSNYSNLRYIDLSNNPDLDLDKTFHLLSMFSKLEVVILDSNGLDKIPGTISLLKNLSHLSLANNPTLNLDLLVESLQYSINLNALNLSNNDIQKLPGSFSKLISITNLRLSNNAIRSSGDFIHLGEMKNLSILWLDANGITALPSSISHLNVKELYLDNNFISQLPEEIAACSELCVMYLGNNKFKELPEEVMNIPKLYFISLNKNDISFIADEFGNSDFALSALILDDNKLPAEQIKRAKKYFSGFFLLSI